MLYSTPPPVPPGLELLDELRHQLATRAGVGGPSVRRLRRQARMAAYAASTSIEGFRLPEHAEAVANRESTGSDADSQALSCYALAMHHVQVLAQDATFRWSNRVLLDLHFEACSFQREGSPGLWRSGPIQVTRPGGQQPYQAPPASAVVDLMNELVAWLQNGGGGVHPAVRAAMAHLHLVSIHPFRDGNGRLARILQSLVLARSGPLPPELGSIEPYLARNTAGYYASLIDVQGDTYDPERDAAPWVAFCIDAHVEEARARLRQVEAASTRWQMLEELVGERGWPDRLTIALELALFGGCARAAYAREVDVSLPTASIDLRRLVDAGLVVSRGRGRSTTYHPSAELEQLVDP